MDEKGMLKLIKRVIKVMISFYLLWLLGASFNFFPFLGDQLEWREIGYCSWLIIIYITVLISLPLNNEEHEERCMKDESKKDN
jgi:hypothetical protein